jgi:hypothetical protein
MALGWKKGLGWTSVEVKQEKLEEGASRGKGGKGEWKTVTEEWQQQ